LFRFIIGGSPRSDEFAKSTVQYIRRKVNIYAGNQTLKISIRLTVEKSQEFAIMKGIYGRKKA